MQEQTNSNPPSLLPSAPPLEGEHLTLPSTQNSLHWSPNNVHLWSAIFQDDLDDLILSFGASSVSDISTTSPPAAGSE